jgi:hypothetical protein
MEIRLADAGEERGEEKTINITWGWEELSGSLVRLEKTIEKGERK